jgi:hypothetical protein
MIWAYTDVCMFTSIIPFVPTFQLWAHLNWFILLCHVMNSCSPYNILSNAPRRGANANTKRPWVEEMKWLRSTRNTTQDCSPFFGLSYVNTYICRLPPCLVLTDLILKWKHSSQDQKQRLCCTFCSKHTPAQLPALICISSACSHSHSHLQFAINNSRPEVSFLLKGLLYTQKGSLKCKTQRSPYYC